MKHAKLYLLLVVGVAGVGYALSRIGRSSVTTYLAGNDQSDVARAAARKFAEEMSVRESIVAGARSVVGYPVGYQVS